MKPHSDALKIDGFSSVDAYITNVITVDLADDIEPTPDLDHLFTPEVVAELQQISETAKAGGKTYTSDQVREYFAQKSKAWQENSPK